MKNERARAFVRGIYSRLGPVQERAMLAVHNRPILKAHYEIRSSSINS